MPQAPAHTRRLCRLGWRSSRDSNIPTVRRGCQPAAGRGRARHHEQGQGVPAARAMCPGLPGPGLRRTAPAVSRSGWHACAQPGAGNLLQERRRPARNWSPAPRPAAPRFPPALRERATGGMPRGRTAGRWPGRLRRPQAPAGQRRAAAAGRPDPAATWQLPGAGRCCLPAVAVLAATGCTSALPPCSPGRFSGLNVAFRLYSAPHSRQMA